MNQPINPVDCDRCENHPNKICFVHFMEKELPPEKRFEAMQEQLNSLMAERLKLRERVRLQRQAYYVLRDAIDEIADGPGECQSPGCNLASPMCDVRIAQAARVQVEELVNPEKKNARKRGRLLRMQLGAKRVQVQQPKYRMPALPSRTDPRETTAAQDKRLGRVSLV